MACRRPAMHPFLTALEEALAPAGLNAVGVADPARWDASVPEPRRAERLSAGTRAIVVVGSGGPALFRAFEAAVRADPGALTRAPHPLDAFVRRAIEAADARLGEAP